MCVCVYVLYIYIYIYINVLLESCCGAVYRRAWSNV